MKFSNTQFSYGLVAFVVIVLFYFSTSISFESKPKQQSDVLQKTERYFSYNKRKKIKKAKISKAKKPSFKVKRKKYKLSALELSDKIILGREQAEEEAFLAAAANNNPNNQNTKQATEKNKKSNNKNNKKSANGFNEDGTKKETAQNQEQEFDENGNPIEKTDEESEAAKQAGVDSQTKEKVALKTKPNKNRAKPAKANPNQPVAQPTSTYFIGSNTVSTQQEPKTQENKAKDKVKNSINRSSAKKISATDSEEVEAFGNIPFSATELQDALTSDNFATADELLRSVEPANRASAYDVVLASYLETSSETSLELLKAHYENAESVQILTQNLTSADSTQDEKQISHSLLSSLIYSWSVEDNEDDYIRLFVRGVDSQLNAENTNTPTDLQASLSNLIKDKLEGNLGNTAIASTDDGNEG